MSEFSHLLSEFIAAKDIGTYSLAQYCGIDRSTIYKIINGKRKPSSMDTVLRMARFMQLTPAEKEQLAEAYRISEVGADVYYRRKDVLDLLENFNYHEIAPMQLKFPAIEPDTSARVFSLTGQAQILPMLFGILSAEAVRGEGHIGLLLPPDEQYVMDLLQMLGRQNPSLEVDHIFCMNQTEQVTAGNRNYNLGCLRRVLPLYICGCRYQAYYYYGNVTSGQDVFRLFPYLILTGSCAIVLSEQLQHAILFRDADTREMLEGMFRKYLNEAEIYLEKLDTMEQQMEYSSGVIFGDYVRMHTQVTFQMQPCLFPFLTDQLLEQYLAADLPGREQLLPVLKAYVENTKKCLLVYPMISIFSENGLRKFLQQGTMEEYPDSYYSIPSMEDRIALIRRMLAAPESFRLRMLRQDMGSIRNGLNIFLSDYTGYLYFCFGESQVFYLVIREPSLLTAFRDFFESMNEELFYTDKDMRKRIEELLAAYKSGGSYVTPPTPQKI